MNKEKITPWIGYDLDGTLAEHYTGKFRAGKIGKPVPKMIEQLQKDLDAGKTVKIFTARAKNLANRKAIKLWLLKQGLPALEVTNEKAPGMVKLYDDRAQKVEKNTGRLL